jgi:hypothetical protein
MNYFEISKQALDPTTPADVLSAISNHGEWTIREKVACNPNAPPETLMILSNEDWIIRGVVVRNPNAPHEILKNLAGDDVWYVRAYVSRRPNITEELIILSKAASLIQNLEKWTVH